MSDASSKFMKTQNHHMCSKIITLCDYIILESTYSLSHVATTAIVTSLFKIGTSWEVIIAVHGSNMRYVRFTIVFQLTHAQAKTKHDNPH